MVAAVSIKFYQNPSWNAKAHATRKGWVITGPLRVCIGALQPSQNSWSHPKRAQYTRKGNVANTHPPLYDLQPDPNGNQDMATSIKVRIEPWEHLYNFTITALSVLERI